MSEAIATVGSLAGLCGYYSGAWQKAPIPWGFSDTVHGDVDSTNVGAGTYDLDGSAVPAGEIWAVTLLVGKTVSATCTALRWLVKSGANIYIVAEEINPTTGVWYFRSQDVILKPTEYLSLRGATMTAGDDMWLQWHGYKIDVDL